MKEIGGYIELDTYSLPMLHEGTKALNCGRNALAYLIKTRNIKNIALPYFLCESVKDVCMREGVGTRYYNIDKEFYPSDLIPCNNEWIYLVNYYGQLSDDDIKKYKDTYGNIIVDNAQAYFAMPVKGVDTLYTCRKFLGVSDGAFLYTETELNEPLKQDESYSRMEFILGRFERSASEFYDMYVANNELFGQEPIKKMSLLTMNLLHGIDYDVVKEQRTHNYCYLHENLEGINRLKLKKIEGAFAYPLLVDNGAEIRRKLIDKKIYIPILWPNVLNEMGQDSLEYHYADNILPLPCDQRYGTGEIDQILKEIKKYIC